MSYVNVFLKDVWTTYFYDDEILKMRYLLYQKYHKLKIISPVEKTFRYMQQELNDFIE